MNKTATVGLALAIGCSIACVGLLACLIIYATSPSPVFESAKMELFKRYEVELHEGLGVGGYDTPCELCYYA